MSEPTQATSSNTAPSHTSAANGASAMPSEAAAPNAPGGGGERSDRNNKRGNYDNKQRRGFGSRGAGGDRHGGRGRGGRGGNNGRGGGRGGRGGRPSARPDKRPTNSDGDEPRGEKKASMMNIPFSAEEIAAEDRRPKKKVAVLIGYAGTGYKGMQINHHEKTIEGDLFAAFVAAGAIAKRNADDPKKSSFVRCARTDKGVHAAGNVVSLKLTIEDADIVEKINEKLPEQIRVWSIQRTNNAFSCYQACDSRWYEYLLPSYTLLPPHPQSFLGKKVIEAAKEKGVYEDTVLKAWDDVKDYWEEVEKNDIQPILDSLDEDVREQVVKLMHASEHPDAKVEGMDAIKTEEGQSATQSVKRKADDDTDDASAKKVKVEDQQETVEDKDITTAAGGEEAPAADAAPVKMETDEPLTKEEPSDAMDIDEKPADATAAGDGTTANGDASKLKYEPTAVETALKDIKTAYIAAKRRYRVTISRVKQLQAALDLYQGTNNFHNYTIQKTFKDPSAKRLIRSFVVNPEPIQIRDTEWLSLKVHGQSFMMHQIRKMVAMAVLAVRCATPLERIRQSYGPTRISIPKAPGLGLLLERPVFESYSKKAKNDFGLEPLSFDKHEEKIKEFKHRMIYNRIWDTEEKEASFHIFLNQLDSFHADYFLWLTAHGFGAAYEPKERYDPKLKPKTVGVKEEQGLVGDDEDAEDGADGAGDEG